jgi:hypothetical protein
MQVDWTQVLLAVITLLGTVSSGYFATRSNSHSKRAAVSADVAVAASRRPPPEVP